MTVLGSRAPGAITSLPRLLPGPGPKPASEAHGLAVHVARHGSLPYRDRRGTLLGDVEAAGLTGRGGAAFPVHRKLRAVLDAAARRHRAPAVIANGAESEPASEKDATLLWLSPHLVLDGLQLAAEAVGAESAVLALHPGRGDLDARLSQALAARRAAGVDRVPVRLALLPPGFLSGQETALLSYLAGGPAIPAFVPPRVTERGLGGAPTLVQNTESLAHLALIARHGPAWFRAVGTPAEPGSMLATSWRADGRPRVSEVPLGFPLADLTGPLHPGDTVLVGGYHGTWLSDAQVRGLTLDNRSLGSQGARLGAGVVATLPASRCGLAETARVVRYLALESAGQCGPCLNGLPRIAAALADIAAGRHRADTVEDVARWSGLVTGRGACRHPDGTARFVSSALRTFAAEIGRHQRGRCSAADTRPVLPVPVPAQGGEEGTPGPHRPGRDGVAGGQR
jgi:NADH:ubiquinone oxidoreductase subunit F (NADH-binding)